jgi:type II secretory pathway pseudopilin PulG
MAMRTKSSKRFESGFSLLELLVATALFMVITGVVFTVLIVAQAHYKSEKSFMGTFQQANIALDQITRDIHAAGYPPAIVYNSSVSSVAANAAKYALPVAWSPTYPSSPCTIGATCATPGDFDLILEADLGSGVQWIRYQLVGTTLYRGVTSKVSGTDPITATGAAGVMIPYLENVMNNASAAQIAAIQAVYPGTFPGNNPVPIFTYPLYNGAPQQPPNIHNINIAIIVKAPENDPQTNKLRVATFTGQASTVNPYK